MTFGIGIQFGFIWTPGHLLMFGCRSQFYCEGMKSTGNLTINIMCSAGSVILTSPASFFATGSCRYDVCMLVPVVYHRWCKKQPIDYFSWSDFMTQLTATSYMMHDRCYDCGFCCFTMLHGQLLPRLALLFHPGPIEVIRCMSLQ